MDGYYPTKDTKFDLFPDSYKESIKVQKIMRKPDLEFFMLSDESPRKPFIQYLEKNKLEYNLQEFQSIIQDTYKVVMALKLYYNRPRPHQVNSEIQPSNSKTDNTPSYPSGHAFQSYVIAKTLSKKYPSHTFKFYNIAERIAKSRVSVGLHYPSDNTCARNLAKYF